MNVARILYIGCKILNYSEKDVFSMTMRKLFLLYDEYLEMNGLKKKNELDLDAFF